MSKWFHKTIAVFVALFALAGNGVFAQVLPLLNRFSGNTFRGTVDVSWPVLFENCTFVTDSIVLGHSYGALFRNCTFESRTGTLYMAESGDGMILADCDVKGCSELRFSRSEKPSDRNYVTGIRINDNEYSVPDDVENVIEMDGLDLFETVKGNVPGPMLMVAGADKSVIKGGETAVIRIRGLNDGMFVGWASKDSSVMLVVDEAFVCRVIAPEKITEDRRIVISAYTEYGLEAACMIKLEADVKAKKEVNKERKIRKSKK